MSDDKQETPADGAVEQDNAPGSPSEDNAPQAASSESDGASGSASEGARVPGAGRGETAVSPEADVAAASDDDPVGSDEAATEGDEAESGTEEVDGGANFREGLGFVDEFVDLVFSGGHGPGDTPETTLAFVEAEGPAGQSVSIGSWGQRSNGLHVLRIKNPMWQDVIEGEAPDKLRYIIPDMVCEAHPDSVWPHDECAGPGMPPRDDGERGVLVENLIEQGFSEYEAKAMIFEEPDAEAQDVIEGDAEQVLFDSVCALAVRQDAELRQLRAAVEPFAKQVEEVEEKRGAAFSRSNTVPISLGRLQELRDALRFRALAPADADDEAILAAAQPVEEGD